MTQDNILFCLALLIGMLLSIVPVAIVVSAL